MIENIADAIPASPDLSAAERSAILEIALLCIASDRQLHADEEKAFRAIGAKIGGGGLDAILGRFDGTPDRADADARLLALAATLTTPASKGLAYKVAHALAMADLATSDEEFEFDLQLVDALGLSQADVDGLIEEVMTALNGTA